MKKGWQTKKLGDVCAFDKRQGIHRGLPYVGLEHIESHTARFIGSSKPQPVKSTTFRFSDKHVLYGRLRPYLNKAFRPEFEGHCSTEIFPIKPRPELSREYLLYWLLADETRDRINATCAGARMPRADMNEVLGFEFPLPPLPEQRRIVGILDEAFDGLATATAEKNLQNARALFESHLQSVFTRRGKGWAKLQLVSVCDLFVDSAHRTPKYQDDGIPALRPRDVVSGKLNLEGALRVCEEEYEIQSKRYKPKPGDIVYSRELSYGWAALLPRSPRVCLSQGMCLFRPSSKLDASFLLYVLNGSIGREQATRAAVGAAHPHINLGDIKSYTIPMPPLEIQRQITEQLNALREETQRLEAIYRHKLAALGELKRSLLHQAFSGQL